MEKDHYEDYKEECWLDEIGWLTRENMSKNEKLERELERMEWGGSFV